MYQNFFGYVKYDSVGWVLTINLLVINKIVSINVLIFASWLGLIGKLSCSHFREKNLRKCTKNEIFVKILPKTAAKINNRLLFLKFITEKA